MQRACVHDAVMHRHLLLIRHAKSDWSNAKLSDFDRPLNGRGKRDAPMMGKRLAARDMQLHRMVSSPALRARSTAERIALAIDFPLTDIDWMTELYLASPLGMLDVIRRCPDDVYSLALVGHNPGITALAEQLTGHPFGNIPTCGIIHLEAKLASWGDAEHFKLVDFDYPKRQH